MSDTAITPSMEEKREDEMEITFATGKAEDLGGNDRNTASGGTTDQPIGDFISKHGVIYEDKQEAGFCSDGSGDEWDTDLETEEKAEEYDPTGRKVYLQACKTLEVTPVSYFLRHIQDPRVDMKHRGLGAKGAKAMAIALVLNTSIVSLNLHDNALGGDGGVYIADMLKENCYISELDLSCNKLGSSGCQALSDMLQYNVSLLKLNLSNNNLSDKDTVALLETFKGNEKLLWLDLSHNRFSENAGENLGISITSNDSLEYLSLSWNYLRRKGAVEVANGLRANCTLKTLDLSFNGFADDGAAAMGEAIRANNTLMELDISNNRITSQGALCIAKGLEGNNTLEVLKIGSNPIGSEGLVSILKAILSYCDSALVHIHCQDIYLDHECDTLYNELRKIKNFAIYPMPGVGGKDPSRAVRRYAEANQQQWMEAFQEYDTDRLYKVTRADFVKGIKKSGLQFDIEETARLLKQLDPKKENLVSYMDNRLGLQTPAFGLEQTQEEQGE
ncbi:leucine-rich repeat-containing protein 74B isoform X3 [Nematostella vectensis]|uniref:leucine-rich repeat-containing protein 74B isoform X3 n=1 Tax=Nematostella vectensis TaxID=45351 RepID=UPI002077036E|nr:leucine-rich repeat-containing protein 74B isoform X3 [Nematostella vectensis]XP_048585715.1 leucine-rich repeat-containing protein 74B isoform X3 [Nematostella vectensis]